MSIKHILLAAGLTGLLVAPAQAQMRTQLGGTGVSNPVTISDGKPGGLTASAATKGRVAIVTDGNAADDCSTGSGSNTVICCDNGSAWIACGGAGGGGVPTTITVADTADTSSYVALFESVTGDLEPKTDPGATYNAGTGTLTISGTVSAEQLTSTDDLTVTDKASIDGTLALATGSITDSTGAISFGNENLTTDGTISATGTISAATGSTIGNLTIANGSITDSSGAISFGNENLTTDGMISATGTMSAATGSIIGSLTLANGSITDSTGAISFGNENLATDGMISATGSLSAATGSTIGSLTLANGSITDSSGAISFGNENLTTDGMISATGALSAATGSTIGNLTLANGSITDSSGAISFGNENLATDGTISATGAISAATGSTIGNLTLANGSITDSSGVIDFGNETLKTLGTIELGHATDTTLSRGAAGVLLVEGNPTLQVEVNNTSASYAATLDFSSSFSKSCSGDGITAECDISLGSSVMTINTAVTASQIPTVVAADDETTCWGTGSDVCFEYDEASDDRGEWSGAAIQSPNNWEFDGTLTIPTSTSTGASTAGIIHLDTNGGASATPMPSIGDGSDPLPIRTCWAERIFDNGTQTVTRYIGLTAGTTSTAAIRASYPMDVVFTSIDAESWQDQGTSEGDQTWTLQTSDDSTCAAGSDGTANTCTWADSGSITCTNSAGSGVSDFSCSAVGVQALPAGDLWRIKFVPGSTNNGWHSVTMMVCAESSW